MRALVRSDILWCTEPGDPIPEKGLGAISGRGGREGDGFQPTRVPVDDGEEKGVTPFGIPALKGNVERHYIAVKSITTQ